MKNKTVILMLLLGSLLITIGSCSDKKENLSSDGVEMDSATVAQRAKDNQVLSTLKAKKEAAEQKANEAIANTKEAKRIEREAIDAADQAEQAFESEEEAQASRQQADEQAGKAEEASNKSDKN